MINPWNQIFQQHGKIFETPQEEFPELARRFAQNNVQTILDLGCGTGRHTVFLTKEGFKVYGMDSAPEALAQTQGWLDQEGITADLKLHDMTTRFPYDDSFFDALISIQVIHHARLATIKAIISEITRVVKPGGWIYITVPSQRNQAEAFEEIEPNTFIPLDGREKGFPHHFFTPDEMRDVFAAFTVEDIREDGKRHYCLLGTRNSS